MPAPVRAHPDGAVVAVGAVPGSSTAAIVGLHGEGLRLREVTVLSGHSARSKQLLVALDAAETTRRLGPWIGHSGEFQR